MSLRSSDPGVIPDRSAARAQLQVFVGRPWLGPALLSLSVVVFLVLYAGIGRPIWFDEFLFFAFGGLTDTHDAWVAITRSIAGTNHSQTGIYMLLDFWLLKIFGASSLALRLPSILSAAFLCYAALRFFEFRSISLLWKIVLVLAFASHQTFVYFVGEARPYMPLAAATVGMLAFYAAPRELRGTAANRLLGFASVILGTLFHPYFPLYWISVLIFLYGLAVLEGKVSLGIRSLVAFCDVRLVVCGMVIFAVISELSWLPRRLSESFDPFQWLHRDRFFIGFLAAHFAFINNRLLSNAAKGSMDSMLAIPAICLATLAALGAGYLFAARRRRRQLLSLLPPVALVGMALGVSLLLSYVSVLSHYWILDRQWIASMALVVIGVVWLFAEIGRQLEPHYKHAGTVLALLFALYLTDRFATLIQPRLTQLRSAVLINGEPRTPHPPVDARGAPPTADAEAWVHLANENIERGGSVWPIFRKYYGD